MTKTIYEIRKIRKQKMRKKVKGNHRMLTSVSLQEYPVVVYLSSSKVSANNHAQPLRLRITHWLQGQQLSCCLIVSNGLRLFYTVNTGINGLRIFHRYFGLFFRYTGIATCLFGIPVFRAIF